MDFFARVSPHYDSFMQLMGNEKNIRRTLASVKNLRPGQRLLDVGGGTGTLALAAQRQGLDVWVADTSEEMLMHAHRKGIPRERLVLADAAALPFPHVFFDIVTCTDALHHFSEPTSGLTGMTQVLRSQGELVILDFDRHHLITRALAAAERLFGEPSTFFTPDELQDALTSMGVAGSIRLISRWQYLYHGERI